jgi:hypothetical protein
MMAKDTDPFELGAAAKQVMEQAHEAIDAYFDFLKKSVSSFPSGGTDIGEKLRDQSVQNITAVHELVKRLSQAKDFEEALGIQTAFMHSQLNALGKQATNLGEAYTKAAADAVSKISKGSSTRKPFGS